MTGTKQSERVSEPCLSGRCFSPSACSDWGYCRERNQGGAPSPEDQKAHRKAGLISIIDEAHAKWMKGEINNPRFATIVGDAWPNLRAALTKEGQS